MENISTILKKYINNRIPKTITNIFWQMFNGIEAMFSSLEYKLDIWKREQNVLTATYKSSLRSIAAKNGFEPQLKIPAKGLLSLSVNDKLFVKYGMPLFLKPYSTFKCKESGIEYSYNSDRTLRISTDRVIIPVIEGEIKQETFTGTVLEIDKFYLEDEYLANDSLLLSDGETNFLMVKSFFDSAGENDDKQFMLKYSANPQNPMILYVKGLSMNKTIQLTYRLTLGSVGNLSGKYEFETEDMVDNAGSLIDIDDDDLNIKNISGFDLGSDGTDINTLRAVVGYNHGSILLFDNQSYGNFIGKFSTILLNKIELSPTSKSINNIYISKKYILDTTSISLTAQYQKIVNYSLYKLQTSERENLEANINEFEYCMSSHNLLDAPTNHFAFQISFQTLIDCELHEDKIKQLLYVQFAKFLCDKSHSVNIEILFDDYMKANKIEFTYMIFNQEVEALKIKNKSNLETPYIIKNTESLPLLKGDFDICDSTYSKLKLFFDINIVQLNN